MSRAKVYDRGEKREVWEWKERATPETKHNKATSQHSDHFPISVSATIIISSEQVTAEQDMPRLLGSDVEEVQVFQ